MYNMDLLYINRYTTFYKNLPIYSKDRGQKWKIKNNIVINERN